MWWRGLPAYLVLLETLESKKKIEAIMKAKRGS